MARVFRHIIGFAVLGFLLWYLARHWSELRLLLRLGPGQLTVMYCLYIVTNMVAAFTVKCLIGVLEVRTRFWDMFWLHNAVLLLNYVPMKFGTLFRANYLKRHYGLSYAHFATFFLYMTFLMAMAEAVIGVIVLVAVYDLSRYEERVLAAVFLLTIVCSLALLFLPLPQPKGQGEFSTAVRNFLVGRRRIAARTSVVLASVALLTFNFFLTAFRLGIVFNSMGIEIQPGGCLILGGLGFVVLFIGITPGALGVRELVLGAGAVALGLPLEVGLFAALIDRTVAITYAFVAGGGCALWLWHKSPADFRREQADAAGK